MKVIVTDVQFRKAFDTVNSVRHLGYEVLPTLSATGFWQTFKCCLGYKERVKRLRFFDRTLFASDLDAVIGGTGKQDEGSGIIIIACEERTVEFLVSHRDLWENRGIRALLPDKSSFDIAVDKGKLMDFCHASGIPAPNSRVCQGETTEREWVIKPARGTGAEGVRYVCEAEMSHMLPVVRDDEIIQEKIPSKSGVQGGFFLCLKGEVVAAYSHIRIRTYPLSGGVTVYSKLNENPDLINVGTRLLKALKWTGFAMVEFIEDSRDGELKVIEVNPRLWGSILLSEFSGANLLRNYILLTEGKSVNGARINPESSIRWIFPYDFIYWLKHGRLEKDFWKTDRNTCYVCKTYTNWFRSIAFQFANVLDPTNVFKFIRRRIRTVTSANPK